MAVLLPMAGEGVGKGLRGGVACARKAQRVQCLNALLGWQCLAGGVGGYASEVGSYSPCKICRCFARHALNVRAVAFGNAVSDHSAEG